MSLIHYSKVTLFLSFTCCFADNTAIYNKAYKLGEQHQFNLNLNANSTINSYAIDHKFESTVANNANKGNAPAKNMYDNTYGDNADPNYLYKEGVNEIANCQKAGDPRCTTLNRYGDKDTQTQIQAYTQGVSTKYQITVTPDPSDSQCMISKRKVPINQTIATCVSSLKENAQCQNTINPYQEYVPPVPADGAILQPSGSPGVCGVGTVTSSWIPEYDRAWLTITSSEGLFAGGNLPIVMGAYSGSTPCRGASGAISIFPTTTRKLLGHFYMDWFQHQKGEVGFYQEVGQNCGINDETPYCSINITLSWVNGGKFTSWLITFQRPRIHSYITHYTYNKGCIND